MIADEQDLETAEVTQGTNDYLREAAYELKDSDIVAEMSAKPDLVSIDYLILP